MGGDPVHFDETRTIRDNLLRGWSAPGAGVPARWCGGSVRQRPRRRMAGILSQGRLFASCYHAAPGREVGAGVGGVGGWQVRAR